MDENEVTNGEAPKRGRKKRQGQDFSEAINASKEAEAKEAADRAAAIEPKRVVRDLPVKLTPDEMQERVDGLLLKSAEEELLVAQKKQASDSFKAKIQTCKDEQRELLGELKAKSVVRPVECVEAFNFTTNTVTTTRTDTDEIVSTRAMTGAERQLCLPVGKVEKNSTEPVSHPPKVDDVPEAPASGVQAASGEAEDGADAFSDDIETIDDPASVLGDDVEAE